MIPDDLHIRLNFTGGFSWFSDENVYCKGFVFTPDGKFLRGKPMLEYFAGIRDTNELTRKVSQANGMFSVILFGENRVWIACDRMRTFPLFYSFAGDPGMIVSDSVEQIIADTGEWSLNPEASLEFLAAGYVTGRETLARDIWQVRSAEIIEICMYDKEKTGTTTRENQAGLIHESEGIRISSGIYSSYRCRDSRLISLDEAMQELDDVLKGLFQRLVDSLQGRTAVIALSGGYDSRLILAMLHKLKYKNLVCFSYGREGNAEIQIAGRVCEKLGTRFIPVIYTRQLIEGFADNPAFREYAAYSSNRVSMFFLQEYFAVMYLKEKELIPHDAVFIPGHSGDFFAGSQLIKHGLVESDESIDKIVRRIVHLKYSWTDGRKEHLKVFAERVKHSIREKSS